jgi:hypothetical protein
MIGLYANWSGLSAGKDFRIAARRTHVQVVMRNQGLTTPVYVQGSVATSREVFVGKQHLL